MLRKLHERQLQLRLKSAVGSLPGKQSYRPVLERFCFPERFPAVKANGSESVCTGQLYDPGLRNARFGQLLHAGKSFGSGCSQVMNVFFFQTLHLAQAEAERAEFAFGFFQGIIPLRMVNVDMAKGYAVPVRIADQLRGLVKAHRLAVQDGSREYVGG